MIWVFAQLLLICRKDPIHTFWLARNCLIVFRHIRLSQNCANVRGTPSASDSRLPSASAPATLSLFRNAFGRMTSYATRSRPASAPDRMVSRDVA